MAEKKDDRWIQGAIENPGEFTEKAERHGMTVRRFIRHVLRNKKRFPKETIKQANLAKILRRIAKRRKKEG